VSYTNSMNHNTHQQQQLPTFEFKQGQLEEAMRKTLELMEKGEVVQFSHDAPCYGSSHKPGWDRKRCCDWLNAQGQDHMKVLFTVPGAPAWEGEWPADMPKPTVQVQV
jgi:hypothetical protein